MGHSGASSRVIVAMLVLIGSAPLLRGQDGRGDRRRAPLDGDSVAKVSTVLTVADAREALIALVTSENRNPMLSTLKELKTADAYDDGEWVELGDWRCQLRKCRFVMRPGGGRTRFYYVVGGFFERVAAEKRWVARIDRELMR